MFETIVIIVLIILIGFLEYLHNEHIKDLELKLLAKNSNEYATYKNIDKPKKPVATKEPDELVDLETVNAADVLKGMGGKL